MALAVYPLLLKFQFDAIKSLIVAFAFSKVMMVMLLKVDEYIV